MIVFVYVGMVCRELQGVDFRCASSSPRRAWVPSIYGVMADTVFPCNSLQCYVLFVTPSNLHHLIISSALRTEKAYERSTQFICLTNDTPKSKKHPYIFA